MGLQTLKGFIYGDIAKHQQTEKETSHHPWQAMASAQQATLFFLSVLIHLVAGGTNVV